MTLAAVGSTNPVKVAAARRVFAELLPEVVVEGFNVPSGVSEQPIGAEETIRGAIGRAKAALAATGAEWGIGMEGGVTFRGDEAWMNGYTAIVHQDGRVGLARGLQVLLPPVVAAGLRAGGELGPLMDQLTGQHDTKHKGGAVGILTNGLVLREDAFAHMVAVALVRFLHPELYAQ